LSVAIAVQRAASAVLCSFVCCSHSEQRAAAMSLDAAATVPAMPSRVRVQQYRSVCGVLQLWIKRVAAGGTYCAEQ
jgi:hypothetical protein